MNWRITVASLALVSTCALTYIHSPADACLHPEREFKYPIKAGSQRGLVMFHNGKQHLVVAPSYKVEGVPETKIKNDAIEGFTSLAMIIPVPALPESYAEAKAEVFNELDEFTAPQDALGRNSDGAKRGPSRDDQDEPSEGATFYESVKAGAYTIQPIKASGEKGGIELNSWLSNNGFGAVRDDLLKYYIDNKFYWLAVKLRAEKGLPVSGNLKPLLLTVATEKPFFPLKIRAGEGEFDAEFWVICAKEIDLDKSKAFGLLTIEQDDPSFLQRNRTTSPQRLPESIKEIWNKFELDKSPAELKCYRFHGAGLNKNGSLAKLEKDLTFEFKAERPAGK